MRGPLYQVKFIHGAGTRVAVGTTPKKNVRMSSTKISGCSNAAKCPGCNTLQSVAHERSAPLSHVVCDEFMSRPGRKVFWAKEKRCFWKNPGYAG